MKIATFVWRFNVHVCSDRLRKLDEMIAAGERSKPLYDSIPETVARLESLQELHLQVQTLILDILVNCFIKAGEFSNSLLQLDSLQTQLSLQLANNLSLLQVSNQLSILFKLLIK